MRMAMDDRVPSALRFCPNRPKCRRASAAAKLSGSASETSIRCASVERSPDPRRWGCGHLPHCRAVASPA